MTRLRGRGPRLAAALSLLLAGGRLLPFPGVGASGEASPRDATQAERGSQPDSVVRLVLNIPAFRLDVCTAAGCDTHYTVAVGSRQYPTKTGRFAFTGITWNPDWVPPPGEWAQHEEPQPPGPSNPMGRVKMAYAPLYFLHGTRARGSLGKAVSHGCIRLDNRDALVLALRLHDTAGPRSVGLDSLMAVLADTTRTLRVALSPPVPFDVIYAVAEVRGHSLWLHPDIYGLVTDARGAAVAALLAAGYHAGSLDSAGLDAAVQRAQYRHVRIPLDSLLPRR